VELAASTPLDLLRLTQSLVIGTAKRHAKIKRLKEHTTAPVIGNAVTIRCFEWVTNLAVSFYCYAFF
jgi:hypothetical protein